MLPSSQHGFSTMAGGLTAESEAQRICGRTEGVESRCSLLHTEALVVRCSPAAAMTVVLIMGRIPC